MAENQPFTPGTDWLSYSRAVYGEREIAAVVESLNSDWLTVGAYTKKFEEAVAKKFGQGYGLFVNSGSSANLLAIQTMNFAAGSEVITPASTFSTTVNPLLQSGLVPVLIDVLPDTFNTDISKIEAAITSKTVALMIPHLVGNLNDMKKLREIADANGLKLIEDSCDTVGSTLAGIPTGTYADASTTSFYASHIITAAGSGGMVMFKSAAEAADAKVRRDWGRALPEHFDESPDKRFAFSLGGVPHDGKFLFERIGYNFKPIDLQAAFGLVQLARLEEFSITRKKNFDSLQKFFGQYPEHFTLPRELPEAKTNWLAYPVTFRRESPLKRVDMMRYLEDRKIQTRVLFAGNISRHPAYKDAVLRIEGDLSGSDHVLEQSMLLGCHHGMRDEHVNYIKETVSAFIKSKVLS